MSKPAPRLLTRPKHAPDLLAFQKRAAEQGWMVRLPSLEPDWTLPEPVDLGGDSVGDLVVRLRRTDP